MSGMLTPTRETVELVSPGEPRRWRRLRGRFGESAPGVIGLVLLIVLSVTVALGPLLWTSGPNQQDLSVAFSGPSSDHPFGTDHLGRDMLARFMAGGRVDLFMCTVSGLLAAIVGLLLGTVAALCPGIVETVCMRLVDSLLALPGIVQAIIFVAVFGRGVGPLIGALAIYAVPIFARVAYSSTQQVMANDYFAAAVVIGNSRITAVLRHVLPNIAAPVLVVLSVQIGGNINIAAALNFFGLGVQAPTAAWGLMIDDGNAYSSDYPLLLIVPGLGLFLAGMAFNLLGDGLRDWLDPRHERRFLK